MGAFRDIALGKAESTPCPAILAIRESTTHQRRQVSSNDCSARTSRALGAQYSDVRYSEHWEQITLRQHHLAITSLGSSCSLEFHHVDMQSTVGFPLSAPIRKRLFTAQLQPEGIPSPAILVTRASSIHRVPLVRSHSELVVHCARETPRHLAT